MNTEQKEIHISKKRELILEVFKENSSKHLTADDVYELASKKDKNIGIATVYRNLKYLEDNMCIQRAYISDSSTALYELNKCDNIHSHHHLICRSCGSVIDFEDDLLDVIEKMVNVTTGFEIDDHNLIFYGKCKNCKGSV